MSSLTALAADSGAGGREAIAAYVEVAAADAALEAAEVEARDLARRAPFIATVERDMSGFLAAVEAALAQLEASEPGPDAAEAWRRAYLAAELQFV